MAIHYELDDSHIAVITIDRPEKRNALDLEHFYTLAQTWKRFRDDAEAWVAIITGTGPSFCAGADLSELPILSQLLLDGQNSYKGMPITSGYEAVLKTLNIYKPIVAAVNGFCVAAGMEMLGGMDIRIAVNDAVFGVLEPQRGVIAGGGTTARLPRQLAWPAAMEILLTADKISAQRALELGLVNQVVSSDELMPCAFEWARRISKNAPLAVSATKESALRGIDAGSLLAAYEIEAQLSARVRGSEDAKEGPRAFMEKRPAVWQGK